MNPRELTKKTAIWAFTEKNLLIVDNGTFIYRHTTWNEQDKEWNIIPIPDLTDSKSMGYWLEEIFPVLTARCYEPEIRYDHEFDQWFICLHNWTSGCSKDSPVAYCKEADGIPQALCECISELVKQEE